MKEFYTTKELAKQYGVTDRTIRNWIYAGLPAIRPFPRSPWRIPTSAVAPAQPRNRDRLTSAAQELYAILSKLYTNTDGTDGAGG